jgi:hypothetical protein
MNSVNQILESALMNLGFSFASLDIVIIESTFKEPYKKFCMP